MPPLTPGASLTPLSFSTYATFQPANGRFSPGMPLDPVQPVQPVRLVDFPTGVNLNQTPRAYEPFGFPALRSFANVELVRLAIETRKDQIERHEWRVKKIGARKSDPSDPGIQSVMKFLRKPDGQHHFASWLRMVIEDLLVLDAPSIEKRRSRGGQLIGLDVVDGATVKVLVDETGRRPLFPEPAYQQVIKGTVWTNLTTRDLIYEPRNRRSNHLYGFGPVEQIIVTINTLLRRQTAQLAHFSAGNVPAGLLTTPDNWSPEQIKQWQDWMDSRLSGNEIEKAKLLWTPKGTDYKAFKEAPIKDEFDEWLARIVAFAFSLPPTPFVKQMNRSTADSDQDRSMMEGLSPLLTWSKRMMDDIIQEDLGHPDLEFAWEAPGDIDPKTQSEIDDIDLKNGSRTLDEVRDGKGLDPYQDPLASQPLVYTANGFVPLSAYQDMRDDKAASAKAAADALKASNAENDGDQNEPNPQDEGNDE
ncbi:phage portal protein [Neorhizobium sp. P12A]|uniref:phage portal protein n=1 Tax=Neorhizobium sp. P12A TaxID=2268027 RepID=UPI0011EF6A39|nr:phage portal protein [Neorhizobium sp. P12A]KAA0686018.1 phage portal protein [Neorhizobium sp. P12A]